MAPCTSVFTGPPPTAGEDAPAFERCGHLRAQRVGGVAGQLPQGNLLEAYANPLQSWAVATSRHVSTSQPFAPRKIGGFAEFATDMGNK
jgi:hypothetical protein